MSSEGDVDCSGALLGYTATSCCTVCSELAVAVHTIPMQLRQCIKIHASKAFVSSCYSNITCFGWVHVIEETADQL